ncbi:aspartic peptidase domain-containing protein [Lactifluus subvellereus]|nr:aspartic peptidase domain-containing protein [Lactifluus subvellereus]
MITARKHVQQLVRSGTPAAVLRQVISTLDWLCPARGHPTPLTMFTLRSSVLLAAFLHVTHGSIATYLDLYHRSSSLPDLLARDTGTSGLDASGTAYSINITLGGQTFSVLIDTGSADLWVAGTVSTAIDTGATATVQYAVGSAGGPVKTAPLELLGFTVPDQAFIEIVPTADAPEGTGLIGLGPSSGSKVLEALSNQATGDPPIDRIFRQDPSTPNFISVLLNRPNDTAEQYTGEMTISQVIPQFQDITNQPKVPVTILQSDFSSAQHFSVLLDANGIIGPDGNAIKTTSNATLAPSHSRGQLVAIFDTGFTLPQVPKYVADAFYSGAPGAKLVDVAAFSGEVWAFDCTAEINATIQIGGQSYPIHPLDMSRQTVDDNGQPFCFGPYQPVIAGAQDPTFDMILGMTFLSNVYLLLNYGDFIDGSTDKTAAPFAQLLSTTDPGSAHTDFVATRLGGKDTTQPHANTQKGSGQKSSGSFFSKNKVPIFIGAAVAVAALIAGVLLLVSRRRKAAYRPLVDPAPQGDMQMHYVSGYNTGGRYADPWNRR